VAPASLLVSDLEKYKSLILLAQSEAAASSVGREQWALSCSPLK
jgi:hypothetical protein